MYRIAMQLNYLQLRPRDGCPVANLVALLRQRLILSPSASLAWMDTPFEAPPALAGLYGGQVALHFSP